jgi:hypothetical protein
MKIQRSIIMLLLYFWVELAISAPFDNPDSSLFLDDIDGSGYFSNSSALLIGYEAYDSDELSLVGDITFGFFYKDTPSVMAPIFSAGDAIGSAALVDFTSGAIVDASTLALKSVFIPFNLPIGFYIHSSLLGVNLFTDPNLNFSLDFSGEFQLKTDPTTYAINFYLPGAPGVPLLSSHAISGINASIPEPPILSLMLCPIAGLFFGKFRESTKKSKVS